MKLANYALNNRALVSFFVAILVIGGILAFHDMSKMEDPEIAVMQAMVVTTYPGASAYEVELRVTDPLEKAIISMGNLKDVQSKSMNDVSMITVALHTTVNPDDIQQYWDILRRKVSDAAAQLPSGAGTPVVMDDFGDVYGMFYAMTSEGFGENEMLDYAQMIQRELENLDGVNRVSIYGSRKEAVNIEFNQNKIATLGVHPAEILMTLTDQNQTVYSGYFNSGDERLRVSVNDAYKSLEDIENLIIQGHEKDQLRLRDMVTVSKGYVEPSRNEMNYDGTKALGIAISMEDGYDITKVGDVVEDKLAELREDRIPAGIDMHKVFFQPDRVRNSMNDFVMNLAMSVALVILTLMVAMGLRSGIIIGVGLIVTVLGSILVLGMMDGTLQRVSLGAFIVAMGMLVDNAIVVLDGILIDSAQGMKKPESLVNKANLTAMPLLGATLIAILAFFPIFLSPDVAGHYVRDLFIVLGVSLMLSWILALVYTPLQADRYLKIKPVKDGGKDIFDNGIYRYFRKMLTYLLSHKTMTIAVIVVLLALSIWGFSFIPRGFFPNMSYDQVYIEYVRAEGTRLESVKKDVVEIEEYLLSQENIRHVTSSFGGTPARYNLVRSVAEPSMGYAEMIVDFTTPKELEKTLPGLQEYLTENYPDAYVRIKRYNLMYMDYPIEVMFTGPDPAVLKELCKQAEDIMQAEESAMLVTNDWNPVSPLLAVNYNQQEARNLGFSRQDVALSLLAATDGLPVSQFYEGKHALPVYLKIVDDDGGQIEELQNAPVWSVIPNISGLTAETVTELITGTKKTGDLISDMMSSTPLPQVSNGVSLKWEDLVVRRYNGQRSINAQCNPQAGYTASQVRDRLLPEINKIELPSGYEMRWMGEFKASGDAQKYLFENLPLAVVLMIMILIMLFKDFKKPLIIALCLPLAIIGISAGMLLSGKEFGFVAIVGALGLIGMMIKNGVVLIDEITLQISSGVEPMKALLDSSSSRLRPVILASFTTIVGMIPLIPDDMFGTMAVTIMGGLFVGTIITLMIIPVFYALFFKIKTKK